MNNVSIYAAPDLLYKDPIYRKSIYSNVPSLSVSSTLELLDRGQQYELYTILEEKFSSIISLKDRIKSLERKYFDIVWLSRKQPKDYLNPNIMREIGDIVEKYPDDLIVDHWTSGFSSGMLACTRLLMPYTLPLNHQYIIDEEEIMYRDDEIEEAENDFPFLDT